jgi:hypothetical protein
MAYASWLNYRNKAIIPAFMIAKHNTLIVLVVALIYSFVEYPFIQWINQYQESYPDTDLANTIVGSYAPIGMLLLAVSILSARLYRGSHRLAWSVSLGVFVTIYWRFSHPSDGSWLWDFPETEVYFTFYLLYFYLMQIIITTVAYFIAYPRWVHVNT